MPIPKAKPVYSCESIPHCSNTLGSTMPEPAISTQPEYLQTLQPFPLQIKQVISISAEGSVNGKYEGRYRTFVSCPNISLAK